jgi:transposase
MPHKGKPDHVKKDAVKRRSAGESVESIAKSLKVSNVAVYQWLEQYKKDALERSKRADMSPKDVALADQRDKDALIQALKDENRRLRNRLGDLLIDGELGK